MKTLKLGSVGEEVKELQFLLISHGFTQIIPDGSFGPKTQKAVKDFQSERGLTPDGIVENKTWEKLEQAHNIKIDHEKSEKIHSVIASSFADPADIIAFNKCKAKGKTDQECFKVGDNGIGKWGDATTTNVPMCALPPEDWKEFGGKARGKKVLVKVGGRSVVCELRDTMPAKKNIKNGAGIDLNFAAWKALGHTPPVMLAGTWQWVN